MDIPIIEKAENPKSLSEIIVLYEDNDIVVVDKPVGMISNRAETVKTLTIQDWWDTRYNVKSASPLSEDEQYFIERSGLVHRLDKETSGVMIMAKNMMAFVELLRQFREREVKKTYLALTHGIWEVKEGEIALPIGRRNDNRQRMGVREDGRESVTQYKVLKEYHDFECPKELKVDKRGYTGFSLVLFSPKTGRMHQIRVHARHMGHPLVGDLQYAGRKRSREDRKWADHVMLIAKTLELKHPVTKEMMKWESGREIKTRYIK